MLSLTSSTAAAPHVLIVDDDIDSCEMYSTCVRGAGLRVSLAYDGDTGLTRALGSRPDLLVTDIVMPGLDGFELTRRLRETATLQRLPVIAVTARTMTDVDVARLQDGGPTSILLKPCEPIRLLVEIWKVLRDSEALRERAVALVERATEAHARAFEACGRTVVRRERWLTLVTSRRLRESERIRDGFAEFPGLMVTPTDASRLWGLDEASCLELLDAMVVDGFLIRCDGRYRRP
jgi:DNA-binding response OmpR family regulator